MVDARRVTVHVEKMMPVTVRGGERALLRIETKGETESAWAIASYIPAAPDHGGPETLVFKSNADGEIEDWGSIAGMRGMTITEAIEDLSNFLNGKGRKRPSIGLEDVMGAFHVMAYPPGPDYYVDEDE